MSIKGVTKIELKNAQGEIVKMVEDTNMLTNALTNKLEEYYYILNGLSGHYNYLFPITTKAYGGILLFNETITEDANITFPPAGVESLGNAGSPTTDTNPFRGDYNQEESGYITNGYRHVFDFATDKGNGVIKSVCLCPKGTGDSGLKVQRSSSYTSNYDNNYIPIVSSMFALNTGGNLINFFEQDGKNYAVFYITTSNNYVDVDKNKYVLFEINKEKEVNMHYNATDNSGFMQNLSTKTQVRVLEISSSAGIVSPISSSMFKDDNYFYINYNTSQKKCMRIKNDLTSYEYVTFPYIPNIMPIGIVDNLLFVPNSNNAGVDIYDMTTQTKIYSCTYAKNTTESLSNSQYKMVKRISENQYAFINGASLLIIDTVLEKVFFSYCAPPSNFLTSLYKQVFSVSSINMTNPFDELMSINNLPEPVTKTAELTMKITYDLLQV